MLGLLFPTNSNLRALQYLVPSKSPVLSMLGQGAGVWDRDMKHGQKGLALHSSSFCQEQIVTSESYSEQGQNMKWISSNSACLQPILQKLVEKSKEKVGEAEGLWRKAGTGYCACCLCQPPQIGLHVSKL